MAELRPQVAKLPRLMVKIAVAAGFGEAELHKMGRKSHSTGAEGLSKNRSRILGRWGLP
jgi:hypothetical protein